MTIFLQHRGKLTAKIRKISICQRNVCNGVDEQLRVGGELAARDKALERLRALEEGQMLNVVQPILLVRQLHDGFGERSSGMLTRISAS